MDIHHYFHGIDSARVTQMLDEVLTRLGRVASMNAETQAKLDALSAEVAKQTTIEQSVATLLNGLSAQIAALKNGVTDPAVIKALDDATAIVAANNAKFVADVTANTQA